MNIVFFLGGLLILIGLAAKNAILVVELLINVWLMAWVQLKRLLELSLRQF